MEVEEALRDSGETPVRLGQVVAAQGIAGMAERVTFDGKARAVTVSRKRVGVLISGRGSNMRSLVEAARAPDFPAEIVLVLSNAADAAGLDFAQEQGIATAVVDHKAFGDRESFERAMHETLVGAWRRTRLPRRLHARC